MSSGITGSNGRTLAWVAIFVGGGSLAVLVVWLLASVLTLTQEVRDSQIEGTPFGKRLQESSDQIIDCTSPEGTCYKRSQRRQGEIVATLNLGAIYGAYCVEQNREATIPQIKACVQRLYEADQKQGE